MDAVKFIEERNRMCKSFGIRCKGCPAFNIDTSVACAVNQHSALDAASQIALVEKWSAANPCKTRQSVFMEQYPSAPLDENGVLRCCPIYVSAAHRDKNGVCKDPEKMCIDCRREFWMREIE